MLLAADGVASALGGTDGAGRFFRDLRKLYAVSQGRPVGQAEYGVELGRVLGLRPLGGNEVAEFDRGHYITREIVYGALVLAGSIWSPR